MVMETYLSMYVQRNTEEIHAVFSYSVPVNFYEKNVYKTCTIQLNYKLAKNEICKATIAVLHTYILISK